MEIKADKIHKAYGTITVLENISFSLERAMDKFVAKQLSEEDEDEE